MKSFKFYLFSIFVLIVLFIFTPFHFAKAFGVINLYTAITPPPAVTFPDNSDFGAKTQMKIQTTVSGLSSAIPNCVRVIATSDDGNTPYQVLISAVNPTYPICPSGTSISGNYSFDTSTPNYGSHTAKIIVTITGSNGGTYTYTKTWSINNPLQVVVTSSRPSVPFGGVTPVTITWAGSGGTVSSCFPSNSAGVQTPGSTPGGANGSFTVNPPGSGSNNTEPNNYYVTCIGPYGSNVGNGVTVTIIPRVTISAISPIVSGNSTTITFDSDGLTDLCHIIDPATNIMYNSSPQILVPPTDNTIYTASCTRNNSPAPATINSANATVTFTAPSVTVSLTKKQANVKNLVKTSSSTAIGSVPLLIKISALPAGKTCGLRNIDVAPTTDIGGIRYIETLGTNVNVNQLANSNNFKLVCDDSLGTESTPVVTVLGQSGTLTSPNPSCRIALGASSCMLPLTWSTTNPGGVVTYFENATPNTPGNSGQYVNSIVSGIGKITIGGTTASVTIKEKNKVDGEGGTATVPAAQVENELASLPVTISCAPDTAWNGSICAGSSKELTASAPTPSFATANVAKTFTSTISNTGNATTGISFNNFFQVASSIHGTGIITDKTSTVMIALGAGVTDTTTVSHTFTTDGTYE